MTRNKCLCQKHSFCHPAVLSWASTWQFIYTFFSNSVTPLQCLKKTNAYFLPGFSWYQGIKITHYTSVVDPHWFQFGSGSGILGQCGSGSRVMLNKNCKILQLKVIFFVIKNYIIFMQGLREGRPSYREAPSSQKRTSSTSYYEISLFSIFTGH